ncbi:MAG: hypothetical protein U1E15_07625 [Hyphomicrobiales bacterium]
MACSRCRRNAKACRHVLRCGLAFAGGRRGDEQARLQVGQPCRHHQVVRRKFQPHGAGLIDIGDILIGQRQNEICDRSTLWVRSQVKQVKRAFKAFQIQDEGILIGQA